jgi:hypothetical protein
MEMLTKHIANLEALAGQTMSESQRARVDRMIATAKEQVAELLAMVAK